MRKKTAALLALFIAVLIIVPLLTWNILRDSQDTQRYEQNIVRNFNNQEEENALKTAESINYTAVSLMQRFEGSSDPENYLHPGTYLDYTCANFIDQQSLNYYQTRYENQQNKTYPKGIQFSYEANVTKWTEILVYHNPAPQNATWQNNMITISTLNGTVKYSLEDMPFFFKNQSTFQKLEGNYDLNFSDCFMVKMKLVYSEYYNPLAAFWANIFQIVIMDRNYQPLIVGLESGTMVS